MPSLRAAYVYDPELHAAANRAGRNYWDAYLREILDELGLQANAVTRNALTDAEELEGYATLIVGALRASEISRTARNRLAEWVRRGGTLIALGTEGIHDLCGNRPVGRIRQEGDEFAWSATFALKRHPLTQGIHPPLRREQRLLIFSEVRKIAAERAVELARLYDRRGGDTGCAAVTARRFGKGRVYYFAFGIAQTIWILHQGRPIDRDYDGDGWLRRSDGIVIRPHSVEVAYADEMLLLLQNMVGAKPHPFLHQLPPDADGEIPDALFFWGGDDEASRDGIQLTASNWMKERGLPYHINAMPDGNGAFGLSPEDAAKIRENGHELAPHFNFMDGFASGAGFACEDVTAQAEAFRRHIAPDWVCSVNHCCRWTGWAEPARWMSQAGGKADNSFIHAGSPPLNPVNRLGFSFGTAFPFWFYEDWRVGNRKLDFLEEPITAYECGYEGKENTDFRTLRRAIDQSVLYHRTTNLFYHPIYVAEYPACRAAIEWGLRYLRRRNIRAVHVGNDALYRWWKARSDARVRSVTAEGKRLRCEVENAYPTGVIVKIPLGRGGVESVAVGAVAARFKVERRFGRKWVLAVAPSGESILEVVLS